MTDGSPNRGPDIDDLVRAALTDDLPLEVEDRLNAQVERFVAGRRGRARRLLPSLSEWLSRSRALPWQIGLGLRVAASVAVIACGIALHGWAGPRLFAAPIVRVQDSVALWSAIVRAPSMQCTGAARDDLGSPADFAERVYWRWVLTGSRDDGADAMALTFRSPADGAQYELVVDRRSMLPSRVVKTPLGRVAAPDVAVTGYDASCRWDSQASQERRNEQQ